MRIRLSTLAVLVASAAAWPSPSTAAALNEVPADRLPPPGTEEVAGYAAHLVWVDTVRDAAGRPAKVVLARTRGRTVRLPIDPVRDLDLGPGPDGRVTAVYVRCRPSCDVWSYDLVTGVERRVRAVSVADVKEQHPSIWGDRIAFERRGAVIVRDLRRRTSHTVARAVPDDIELGAKHLAYVALAERGEGNGTVELRLRGLASGRDEVLDDGVIGEGVSTGFGALTFEPRTLFWQKRIRDGCKIFAPSFFRYRVRRARVERLIAPAGVPLSVQRAAVDPPGTPESDFCDEEF